MSDQEQSARELLCRVSPHYQDPRGGRFLPFGKTEWVEVDAAIKAVCEVDSALQGASTRLSLATRLSQAEGEAARLREVLERAGGICRAIRNEHATHRIDELC